jgi:hypothetical protein
MEHNKNTFASAAPPKLPAEPVNPPSALDFDPVEVSSRCDGWTPKKQREFIEALADCGVVSEAAARVRMTVQSANRLRRRPDAANFNRAWELAIRIGADRLRSVAYERAVTGTVRPRYYKGEKIGEDIVYDNRLLISLLGKIEAPLVKVDAPKAVKDWGRLMEAIENGTDVPAHPADEAMFRLIRSLLDPEGTIAPNIAADAETAPSRTNDSAE